jgi:MFS family permease
METPASGGGALPDSSSIVIQGAPKRPDAGGRRRRALIGRRLMTRPIGINVKLHTLDSLRYRNFRLMWALTFSVAGFDWLHSVVMGWMTFDVTRSPLLTSLALAMSSVPFLLVGPFAGVLVDNWDRRKVLAAGMAAKAILVSAFTAVVLLGYLQTWHIFAFLLAIGLAAVLTYPAMVSLVSNIVPRQNLVNAYALNSFAYNSTRLFVPAIAGLSIILLGPGRTLLLGVAMLLAATLAAQAIRVEPARRKVGRRRSPLIQLAEAARYVRGEHTVLALLLMSTLSVVFLLPFVHGLLPVYAASVFDVGPAGLGLLVSAPGVGSMVGTALVASAGDMRRIGRVIVVGLVWATIAMVAFSRSGSFVLSLLILMVLSGGLTTFYTVSGAAIQSSVPDELRGRIASLGGVALGFYPVGAIVAGTLAELLGAPAATLIAGAVLVVLLIALLPVLRSVWRIGEAVEPAVGAQPLEPVLVQGNAEPRPVQRP